MRSGQGRGGRNRVDKIDEREGRVVKWAVTGVVVRLGVGSVVERLDKHFEQEVSRRVHFLND